MIYCMAQTFYMEFNGFAVSGRTVKLKSVNWMKSAIHHHDLEYKTGLS